MLFRKGKNRQWSFAFEGRVADGLLKEHGLSARGAGAPLLEKQAEIEDEIQSALAKALRAEVAVSIEFDESSLEWFGEIDAQCENRFGTAGLAGLRQLVGSAVSRSLGKHLPAGLPRAHTRVAITAGPWAESQGGEAGGMSKGLLLLVLSTICLYVVAIAVLGLIGLSLLGVISVPGDNTAPADASYQSLKINYL